MFDGIFEQVAEDASGTGEDRKWTSAKLARYPQQLAEEIADDLIQSVQNPISLATPPQVNRAPRSPHVFPSGLRKAVKRCLDADQAWQW